MEVGARELVMDALQERVGVSGGRRRGARGPRPRALYSGVWVKEKALG